MIYSPVDFLLIFFYLKKKLFLTKYGIELCEELQKKKRNKSVKILATYHRQNSQNIGKQMKTNEVNKWKNRKKKENIET
jgi:hypothetical protein